MCIRDSPEVVEPPLADFTGAHSEGSLVAGQVVREVVERRRRAAPTGALHPLVGRREFGEQVCLVLPHHPGELGREVAPCLEWGTHQGVRSAPRNTTRRTASE